MLDLPAHLHDLSLLTAEDAVVAYRLIEELCERGHDTEVWREHFVNRLREIFGAVAGVSYVMKFAVDPGDIGAKTLSYVERGANDFWRERIRQGDVRNDPATPFIMARFGTDFTCSRAEWIDDETIRASAFYQEILTPAGWEHAIYSQVAITRPGVVDGIGIVRALGTSPYSARDVALVRLIHQELARLWRKHDPLDMHTIPPRQREVLQGIRRGDGRRTIAENMCLSEHTVHTYEKMLFERAKVSTRSELQAIVSQTNRPVLMP